MSTNRAAGAQHPEGERLIFAALLLFGGIAAFAVDVSMPAIPLLADALEISRGQAQLSVSCFLAGLSLGQIPLGLIADRIGRLPVAYACLSLFCAGGLLAACADSAEVVFAARFVQGLSASSGPLLARAIARDLRSGKEFTAMLASFTIVLAVNTLIAPLIGALVMQFLGWRAPFVASVIFGGLCFLLLLCWVPETLPARSTLGAWRQAKASLAVCLRNRQTLWGASLVGCVFFGYMAMLASFSSVLVDVYLLEPVWTGPLFCLVMLAYILGANWSRVSHWSKQRLIRMGGAFFIVSILALAARSFFEVNSVLAFVLVLLPFLFGMGLLMPIATATALQPLQRHAALASALVGTVQMGMGALGSLFAGVFYMEDEFCLRLLLLLASLAVVAIVFGWRVFGGVLQAS